MSDLELRYFVLYKPRNMVSQFVSPDDVPLLGEIDYAFPEGIHAIGRLDKDSEGLLLLTTDKRITKLLFQGKVPHERTYLVKVFGEIQDTEIEILKSGVTIPVQDGGFFLAKPIKVDLVKNPEDYVVLDTDENPYLKYSWIAITLTDGKYHQVRKMVYALKHPCLRLIRIRMVDLYLDNMQPGEVREFTQETFFRVLQLNG